MQRAFRTLRSKWRTSVSYLRRHNPFAGSKTAAEKKAIWDKVAIVAAVVSLPVAVLSLIVAHNVEVVSVKNSSAYVLPNLSTSAPTVSDLDTVLTKNFQLTNFGQTPAINVKYKISYNYPLCPGNPTASEFSHKMFTQLHGAQADSDAGAFQAPNLSSQGNGASFNAQFSNPHLDTLDKCNANQKMVDIFVYISYETIFGDKYRTGTLMETSFFGTNGPNIYTAKTDIIR